MPRVVVVAQFEFCNFDDVDSANTRILAIWDAHKSKSVLITYHTTHFIKSGSLITENNTRNYLDLLCHK